MVDQNVVRIDGQDRRSRRKHLTVAFEGPPPGRRPNVMLRTGRGKIAKTSTLCQPNKSGR